MKNPFACLVLMAVVVLATGTAQAVTFRSVKLSPTDPGPTREISGLLSRPDGDGPFAAVVLLHTCGGMRPHVTKDWPRYLNGLGYVTLTVDSMKPRGLKHCDREVYDMAAHPQDLSRDAYGALDWLAHQPFIDGKRIGVMGFSLGGATITYFAARNFATPGGLSFRAAVDLYGRCFALPADRKAARIPMRTSDTMIPLVVIVGAEDQKGYIVDACKAVNGKGKVRTYVLPDTYHAFDVAPDRARLRYDGAGNPMLYSEAAVDKARAITKAFFAHHLRK